MTEIISRLYGGPAAAQAAVDALVLNAFPRSRIFVVAPPAARPIDAAAEAKALEALTEQIMQGWVARYPSSIYAKEVLAGGVLVNVRAPFGFGQAAYNILDAANPIASAVVDPQPEYLDYDEAAPLSSVLGLPPIVAFKQGFSGFCSISLALCPKFSLSRLLGLAELTKAQTASIGLPTLVRRPGPYVGLFNLPLLLKS